MKIERSSMLICLPADVWTRIVFAARESEDERLRSLIEQAIYEAVNPGSQPGSGA